MDGGVRRFQALGHAGRMELASQLAAIVATPPWAMIVILRASRSTPPADGGVQVLLRGCAGGAASPIGL
jgi:hypothetical protein